MKIHVVEKMAFLKVGTCTYLYLGTSTEVENATPEQISEIVISAFAHDKFNRINTSPARVH